MKPTKIPLSNGSIYVQKELSSVILIRNCSRGCLSIHISALPDINILAFGPNDPQAYLCVYIR